MMQSKGTKAFALVPFQFRSAACQHERESHMKMRYFIPLIMAAGALSACGQSTPEVKSGAPMPEPTVSQGPDMPAGTQMAALSMINAKVKKPIDGRPTAGYLIIENGGPTPETITGLSSPDFGRVELHDHIQEGAMMRMVKLESAEVPGNGQLQFTPGGKHLMMFDAKRALANGDSVKVTFTFSNSGPIETNFVVLSVIPPSTGGADPMAGQI
jgi:periplasmic copper chaperone A